MIVRSIGLDEALAMWFSGQKLDGLALYGLSVVWWARFAKIATYAAGLVVVLDIIGPERIRAFGARTRRNLPLRFQLIVGFGFIGLVGILTTTAVNVTGSFWPAPVGFVLLLGSVWILPKFDVVVVALVARVLENPKSQLVVQTISVVVLTLAFFVDLLTS